MKARNQAVKKPFLPSPAGDLTHRQQADIFPRCRFHSALQDNTSAIVPIGLPLANGLNGAICKESSILADFVQLRQCKELRRGPQEATASQ